MSLDTFLETVTGQWVGDETIRMGPAPEPALASKGRLEISPAFQGSGFVSSYAQEVNGEAGLVCETLFRFADDGALTIMFMPADGDPLTYQGQRDGAVIQASRMDEADVKQVLISDYSVPDQFHSRVVMVMPDGTENTVFDAVYHKQTKPSAQPSWHDLTVDKPDQSLAFYEAVFGGAPIPISMGDYNDYCLTNADGEVLGGLCHARGGNADLPPVWLTYFPVPSVDHAITAATTTGGTLMSGPATAGGVRYAVLSDPSGAAFTISEG